MNNEARAVAKSLHTVTVIVQVARGFVETGSSPAEAVEVAKGILCLAGRPDPYGLAAQALKQLQA